MSRKQLGAIILQATEDWKGEQEKNNKTVVISFMNMINVQRPKVFKAPEYTYNKWCISTADTLNNYTMIA